MSLFVLLCLITWILNGMDCDPDLCQYCLNQYNFNDGTFRIKLSGIYCLSEDITFDPKFQDQYGTQILNMHGFQDLMMQIILILVILHQNEDHFH